MTQPRWAGLIVVLAMSGCAGKPASQGGFDSPDPQAKLYAIVRAGEQRDASKIPQLIDQLESDDQAVRMYAIEALEKITGTRMGYVYYDPPAERAEQVRKWLDAYRGGQLKVASKARNKSTTEKR